MEEDLLTLPTPWSLQTSSFQSIDGLEFDFIRGGTLSLQLRNDPSSDAISLPFLWARRRFLSFRGIRGVEPPYEEVFAQEPYALYWWEIRPLNTDLGGGDEGGDVDPTLANPTAPTYDSIYYLALGSNLNPNPVLLRNISRIDSSDPSTDPTIFNYLISRSYQIREVNYNYLGIAENQPVAAVPEPSSVWGILVLGVIGLGWIVKRKFSQVVP